MNLDFVGKSVYITGANRGIGLAVVRQMLLLTNKPSHVFAGCRHPEMASDLQELKSAHPNTLHVVKHDVTHYTGLDAVVEYIGKHVGSKGLNILINNAAIYNKPCAGLEVTTPEDMRQHFETNTVAPFIITRAFLPLLKRAEAACNTEPPGFRRAAIVNISGMLASLQNNQPGSRHCGSRYSYRASKTALNAITKSLSVELKDDNIVVVLLHPGSVKGGMGSEENPVTLEESARGLVRVVASLNENSNGHFVDFLGQEVPW